MTSNNQNTTEQQPDQPRPRNYENICAELILKARNPDHEFELARFVGNITEHVKSLHNREAWYYQWIENKTDWHERLEGAIDILEIINRYLTIAPSSWTVIKRDDLTPHTWEVRKPDENYTVDIINDGMMLCGCGAINTCEHIAAVKAASASNDGEVRE